LDFCDDVTTGEMGRARALLKSLDGFKDGGPAAQAGVSNLGLRWWDGDRGPVDDVVAIRAVRIV
jgi:hypothetical protein